MLPWIVAGIVLTAALIGYAAGAIATTLFGAGIAIRHARRHLGQRDLVWWSDCENEYAEPEIYATRSHALDQAIEDFKTANWPELQDADLRWEPEGDSDAGPLVLIAAGKDTGIVVRPLTVRTAARSKATV